MKQLSIRVTICKNKPCYRSKYGFQNGAFAHTEQQAIKARQMTSVKPFKRENQLSYIYEKREARNTYKPYQQTTSLNMRL